MQTHKPVTWACKAGLLPHFDAGMHAMSSLVLLARRIIVLSMHTVHNARQPCLHTLALRLSYVDAFSPGVMLHEEAIQYYYYMLSWPQETSCL
jgi:hypothetical protein